MANPAFNQLNTRLSGEHYAQFGAPQTLEQAYAAPSAGPVQTGRLTFDDVVMKTLGLLAIVIVVGAGTWSVSSASPGTAMLLWWVGMIGTLVLGFAIAMIKRVIVPLILLYAALEGVFVGAISQVLERSYPGVVITAVMATVATFAAVLLGYRSKLIRVTDRSRRIFGMAVLGYLAFSLVNVVALLLGWTSGWGFGGNGPLGIVISVLGVGLASYSLAVSFDQIDRYVRAGVPQKYSWLAAHGLIVGLVWLYVEMLRLFSRLRG